VPRRKVSPEAELARRQASWRLLWDRLLRPLPDDAGQPDADAQVLAEMRDLRGEDTAA
jgi:hypothetical protein